MDLFVRGAIIEGVDYRKEWSDIALRDSEYDVLNRLFRSPEEAMVLKLDENLRKFVRRNDAEYGSNNGK